MAQLPNSKIPVLESDGSMTLPWRQWAQALSTTASSVVVTAVTSFNTRFGAVLLTATDIIAALGFTPGQGTVTTTGTITIGSTAVFTGATTIGAGAAPVSAAYVSARGLAGI